MSKKSKCATALLATALLAYGFTLDTEQEINTAEPEIQREVAVEKESTPITEPQHLVSEEEIQVEILVEEVKETEVEIVVKENEPQQTETPPQVTTLTQTQADRTQPDPQAQEVTATREPTSNIPEPDSMNGIDYGTSQSIQPEVDPRPTYTEEQLTDPTQKPDGTPVEVYLQDVTPPTSTPEENSVEHAYVPGFGWVPIPDPCEVIFAEDMFTNGNKVGTMGGG